MYAKRCEQIGALYRLEVLHKIVIGTEHRTRLNPRLVNYQKDTQKIRNKVCYDYNMRERFIKTRSRVVA